MPTRFGQHRRKLMGSAKQRVVVQVLDALLRWRVEVLRMGISEHCRQLLDTSEQCGCVIVPGGAIHCLCGAAL